MRFKSIIFFLFCILCMQKPAPANEAVVEVLQKDMRDLKESMVSLESLVRSQNEIIKNQTLKIAALERGEVSPREAAAPERAPQMGGLSQGFNPDMGVVGTVQVQFTEDSTDGEGRDTIALKEIELNVSQYVDPYSRLDAVLSFNDAREAENTEIEEAYYTHWDLPFGFQGQIGKFRSKIGKQNLLHLDQLPTVDFPLVIQNFFGEEGLSSSGVRLQNWVPIPWEIPVEVTGEVLRGNNGASFSGVSRRPIFTTHVKTFFEPSQNSTLELGGTAMFGDENPRLFDAASGTFIAGPANGQDRFGIHVVGADATFIRNLAEGRALKFQNEVYVQDRGSNSSIQAVNINTVPWGFYTLLDFRFSPKFSAGVRLDYLEPLAVRDQHGRTTAISPYLTFWQSEFANFRLQYSHSDPASANAEPDDAIYLQANFLIGVHRHPVQ